MGDKYPDKSGGRLVVSALPPGEVAIDAKVGASNLYMFTYDVAVARQLRDALSATIVEEQGWKRRLTPSRGWLKMAHEVGWSQKRHGARGHPSRRCNQGDCG